MDRRAFLFSSLAVAGGGLAGARLTKHGSTGTPPSGSLSHTIFTPIPAYSVTPIVGDGHWVWTEAPKGVKGYLEPRKFDVTISIELEGVGNASGIKATTAAPVEQPEQKIGQPKVQSEGCEAVLRPVASTAGQLVLSAPSIAKGQTIRAEARYQVTLSKDYRAFEKDQFPAHQKPDRDSRYYLGESPGIQSRDAAVVALARKLAGSLEHPWDQAHAFYQWVWENIHALKGPYTSVLAALKNRVGDCEERAAVFVAFCRAVSIPARLVWIPNHNWAEIHLHDEQGKGHWIPVHTAGYSWFGWTGAHELVLQKGDRLSPPESGKYVRLLADWMQWKGRQPQVRYLAEVTPVAYESGSDAGPGHRKKNEKGEWVLVGDHPMDQYMRDGIAAASGPIAVRGAVPENGRGPKR